MSLDASHAPVAQAYVLVHGAFLGGWCWQRVEARLMETGARVFAPALKGVGEKAHLFDTSINLSTHVSEITQLIHDNDLHDFVLCGHSYGGIVVSGVAEQLASRIHSLVYLDALLPDPGQCVWDLLPAASRQLFETYTKDGAVHPAPATASMVNVEDIAWVDSQTTPHPFATFKEPLPDTHFRSAVGRKAYVRAIGYPNQMLEQFAQRVKSLPGWDYFEVSAAHNLMIDAPQAVADILFSMAVQQNRC